MSLITVPSVAVRPPLENGRIGRAKLVAARIEVHIGPGLPGYDVVGMPGNAVREQRDRVRAAMLNSQLDWPNRRITVNLALDYQIDPFHDLATALGIHFAPLGISSLHEFPPFVGVLGLDGSINGAEQNLRSIIEMVEHDLKTQGRLT